MKNLKQILKQANVIPDLKLFIKREGGGTQSTGPHKVKLIDSKIIKGTDFKTNEEIYVVRLLVEEDGEQKKYDFPMKDKKGDIHYLVQRLAEFEEGSEVILEGKSEGGRSFTNVSSVNTTSQTSEEEVPTITQDKDIPIIEEKPEKSADGDEEEIRMEDIPF